MDLLVLCVACLTVFVNCLVKQFAMCLVAILLLNVMEVFCVCGGAPFDTDRLCMAFQRMCVLCNPSVHLSVPSIGLFMFLYVRSYLLI